MERNALQKSCRYSPGHGFSRGHSFSRGHGYSKGHSFFRTLLACAVGFGLCAVSIAAKQAVADEPTAMVEDITSDRDDVQLMDYLTAGQRIDLASGETLTLGYLLSCVQETIVGGTVIIGEDESTVEGGEISREWIDCDGGSVVLNEGQNQEAGAMAFRNSPGKCDAPKPDRVIYGVSPVIKFQTKSAPITIKAACAGTGSVPITLNASGKVADARKAGIRLTAGQTYLFEAGGRSLVVKVSKLAEDDPLSTISRLVPM